MTMQPFGKFYRLLRIRQIDGLWRGQEGYKGRESSQRFSPDKSIVRHAKQGEVAHACPLFMEGDRLEMAVKIGHMIGIGENVIAAEPHRPEGTREPGMAAMAGRW